MCVNLIQWVSKSWEIIKSIRKKIIWAEKSITKIFSIHTLHTMATWCNCKGSFISQYQQFEYFPSSDLSTPTHAQAIVTNDVNVNVAHPPQHLASCLCALWVNHVAVQDESFTRSVSQPPLGSSWSPFGYWMPGHFTGQCCNSSITQSVPAGWLLLAHQRQQAHVSHRFCTHSHLACPQQAVIIFFWVTIIAYLRGS